MELPTVWSHLPFSALEDQEGGCSEKSRSRLTAQQKTADLMTA